MLYWRQTYPPEMDWSAITFLCAIVSLTEENALLRYSSFVLPIYFFWIVQIRTPSCFAYTIGTFLWNVQRTVMGVNFVHTGKMAFPLVGRELRECRFPVPLKVSVCFCSTYSVICACVCVCVCVEGGLNLFIYLWSIVSIPKAKRIA